MMPYKLKRPCDNCPFLKQGGIRLAPARASGLVENALSEQGNDFPCHKTVEYEDDQPPNTQDASHCVGSIIFSLKHDVETQMMRIAARLRLYDPAEIMADKKAVASVFDSASQMMRANRKGVVRERTE
jgi:hypothetical protein